jgi:rare lipoprotein A (peptidoglycan hydrolase)
MHTSSSQDRFWICPGSAFAGCVLLATISVQPASAQDRYVDRAPSGGNVYGEGYVGTGGAAPSAFIQGDPPQLVVPATAVPYGAGKTDEASGQFVTAYYDPPSASGFGVATWFDDDQTSSGTSANQAGLFCALPMDYTGPDESYKEKVKGTPIPEYPFGTLLRVTNSQGDWIVCAISDRGPALYTGAAIDLSTDAKIHLGMAPGDSGNNFNVYYEVVRNTYDPTFQTVKPIQ